MDRGPWWAAVYEAAKSRTRLSNLSSSCNQYSCLGDPPDREAWQATVHWGAQSQTQLSDRTHFHLMLYFNSVTLYHIDCIAIICFLKIVSSYTHMVKNLPAMQKTQIRSLSWEVPLEKERSTLSNILAWRIPRKGKPGGLQSMGSQESDTTE